MLKYQCRIEKVLGCTDLALGHDFSHLHSAGSIAGRDPRHLSGTQGTTSIALVRLLDLPQYGIGFNLLRVGWNNDYERKSKYE